MPGLIDPAKITAIRRVYEQTQDFWVTNDSIVSIPSRPGETFRVIKVNPKNLVAVDTDGKQWRLTRAAAQPAPVGTQHEEPVPDLPRVKLGTVVRFTDSAEMRAGAGPWVCVKAPDERGRARYVKLGGAGTQIWTVHLEHVEIWEGTWS